MNPRASVGRHDALSFETAGQKKMENIMEFWRMSKVRLAALIAAIAVGCASASAEPLRGGDAFITAMQGNTLTGKAIDGVLFKVYFLPAGGVTLERDSHEPEHGKWSVDKSGDICVAWDKSVPADEGCFRIDVSGSKVTWSNKDMTHSGGLLGGVFPLQMQKAP